MIWLLVIIAIILCVVSGIVGVMLSVLYLASRLFGISSPKNWYVREVILALLVGVVLVVPFWTASEYRADQRALRDQSFENLHFVRESLANDWDKQFAGLSLARMHLEETDLSEANLASADLTRSLLVNADLRGANLFFAEMSNAQMFGVNLAGANLGGANLSNANLVRADLTGASLAGANLSGASLTEARLPDGFDRSTVTFDDRTTWP